MIPDVDETAFVADVFVLHDDHRFAVTWRGRGRGRCHDVIDGCTRWELESFRRGRGEELT